MKSLLLITLAVLLLASCSKTPKEGALITNKIKAQIAEEDAFPYDTLRGMYIGDFGGSQIRVVINYISGTNAIGYDIHRGLQRNIMGKVTRSGDSITVTLAEPGDHEFDGVFTLNFDGIDATPKAKWTANNKKIPGQNFKLTKQEVTDRYNSKTDKITTANFASVFGQVSDSVGQYDFKDDGLVIFSYYSDKETDFDKQQMKEIKGSWELNGTKLAILWQPNKIFKNNRSDYTLMRTDYDEPYLKSDGGYEMWMMYW